MEKVGIKELKESVDAVLGIIDLGKDVLADKKVGFDDLPVLFAKLPMLVKVVPEGISGAEMIPQELSDLSEEESFELVSHVMLKLSVGDEKAKDIVAKSMKLIFAGAQLAAAIKA